MGCLTDKNPLTSLKLPLKTQLQLGLRKMLSTGSCWPLKTDLLCHWSDSVKPAAFCNYLHRTSFTKAISGCSAELNSTITYKEARLSDGLANQVSVPLVNRSQTFSETLIQVSESRANRYISNLKNRVEVWCLLSGWKVGCFLSLVLQNKDLVSCQ